jgi:hypothetical protein
MEVHKCDPNSKSVFAGVIEFRFLRGPFFAELILDDDSISIRPRFIPVFRAVSVSKDKFERISIGRATSRGVRFVSGVRELDRLIFVPISPKERARIRYDLHQRGFPVID